MFYDRYVELCREKGVSPSRAAIEAGLSKSTVTKWKNDPNGKPTGNIIDKLTKYFGVSIAMLLDGSDPDTRVPTDSEIKLALFGPDVKVTDSMYNEVRSFAAFVAQREAARQQNTADR